MDDLISRQAAIDAITDELVSIIPILYGRYEEIPLKCAAALRDVPSAVKHGKWEYIGGYGYQYRCSKCVMCAEYKTNYCPNCGARMEE